MLVHLHRLESVKSSTMHTMILSTDLFPLFRFDFYRSFFPVNFHSSVGFSLDVTACMCDVCETHTPHTNRSNRQQKNETNRNLFSLHIDSTHTDTRFFIFVGRKYAPRLSIDSSPPPPPHTECSQDGERRLN